MNSEVGTLKPNEPHPMAYNAMGFINSFSLTELLTFKETLASCAIEGNRMAEICGETLRRVLDKEPVSDRYILGLAWFLKVQDDDIRRKGGMI